MDNEARAGYGHMAIQNGSPDYGDNEFSEDATDTVANILHAIHEQGADPAQVLRCAVMHFEAEAGEGAAVNFLAGDPAPERPPVTTLDRVLCYAARRTSFDGDECVIHDQVPHFPVDVGEGGCWLDARLYLHDYEVESAVQHAVDSGVLTAEEAAGIPTVEED